jgi:hypothetical protein
VLYNLILLYTDKVDNLTHDFLQHSLLFAMAASVIIKKVELFIIFCGLPAGWWLHVVLSLKTASCSIFFSFITEDFCVCNIVGTTTDRLPKGLFLPVFFVPSIDIIHKNEPSRQIMTI